MKKICSLPVLLAIPFFISGCLVGERIIYEVRVDKSHEKGTAEVTYKNIRSDGETQQERDEDKKNLFEYMQKSPAFVSDMKAEGKEITDRKLYTDDDRKLNGRVNFRFSRLSDVENMAFEDGFYFLTLALDDSVASTNGEVIRSANYKRILWDESHDVLKFEIYTEPAEGTQLLDLAPLFKPQY